jgi:hypothetical protein
MDRQKPYKGVKMLSPDDKARILSWQEEGVSVGIIANRLGCHRSAIFCLLNKTKYLAHRQIPERKKGSGIPKKIPGHALKVLERFVKKNPCATAGDIKQQVPEEQHFCVTHQLVDSEEAEDALQDCRQKPLLTEKMKKKRLAFAKKYRS